MNRSRPLTLQAPLTDELVSRLRAGDRLFLHGHVYVARDQAHKRMSDSLARREGLPFDATGQIVYYMGPSPARPGKPIGSAGPTTSGRMDVYTLPLLEAGLKGLIGKGSRSPAVREALVRHRAVYLATLSGAGALLARSILRAQVVAYPELGGEALLHLEVSALPAIVVNDVYGGDAYELARASHRPEAGPV
jgi:fumarate hydratase subunit beta